MKSQLFSLESNARSNGPQLVTTYQDALQVLSDDAGAVAFGWVAEAVLYTQFQGRLSAETGHAYAIRLSALVAQTQLFSFFCDASGLKYCDLLARSAFARVLLSNRRRFASLVVLTWAEGQSQTMQALVAMLGEPIEVLKDSDAFEASLLHKAPLALRKLHPETWLSTAQSSS